MNLICRHIREIAEVTVSFVVSVCLSTWNNSAPSGQMYMKFDISLFFKKNTVDHFHVIFMNIAVIRFDSHIYIYLIGKKHTKTVCFYLHFECPWSHYQLVPAIFMPFTAAGVTVCFLLSVSQSVSNPSTGIYEIVCTFQCHSQSYGTVPLITAFLYVAVLNKISSSSCNRCHFMYFVICKLITLSRTLLDIIPLFQNCV
jgi:hypothetical protein